MTDKKSDILKNILINLGVLLILVGSAAIKGDLTFFLIGMVLLAFQTFELPSVQPKKLVIAELILAATLAIGAVTQLVNANIGRNQQIFLVVLLLGALLIVVESTRKYADL
jgi:hypothetical protein